MGYNGLLTSNGSNVFIREIISADITPPDSDGVTSTEFYYTNNASRTTDNVRRGYGLTESILLGIILSSFIVLALAGNALVMVAILTDRHLRKTSNYFIVSLAVADALVALVVMTFSLVNDLHGHWIFGRAFCNIWMSSDVMCSTASIMNLCAISLDRYIHIRNPLHYETWVTPRRTLLAIFFIWMLSALISFLPIQLGWHRAYSDADDDVTDVGVFICSLDLNPIYAILSSIISFYLPFIVMILIYVKLYHYAKIHVKRIRQDKVLLSKTNSSDAGTDARKHVTEHKAAVTLGVIMGVFLVCWAPFFTANVVGAFCPSCVPSVVFSIFTWLGYVNSTMNPIIYSIFNQEFSQAFKRVLASLRFYREERSNLSQTGANQMHSSPDRIEMNGCNYGTTRSTKTVRYKEDAPIVYL